MTRFFLILLCLGLSTATSSSEDTESTPEPGFGGVKGYVLDANGEPVEKAEVYCQPVAEPGMGGRASVLTDADGGFFLDRVVPGLNAVHASKPGDGYPDTLFAFFVTDPKRVPKVLVQEDAVASGVVVGLGPRYGRLTGHVLDSETGAPVVRSEIRLYHQRNPEIYLLTAPNEQGEFDFLIPPVDIRLRVTATGYRDWEYSQVSGSAIRVQHENSKEVPVVLKRRQ